MKKITNNAAKPAATDERGVYFDAFGASAWTGSHAVMSVLGLVTGILIVTGRMLLHVLVRAGGFCFGVLLALACLVGLGYLVAFITGRTEQ